MNREAIYGALFSLVSSVPGIVTASRRVRHWADVSPVEQPALFLVQKTEVSEVTTKIPGRWTFNVDIVVYVNTGGHDSNITPSTLFNPIVDAITTALVPPQGVGEQLLGGLVTRCRVAGTIETDEGALGEQAVVIIPVVLYTPDY